MQADEQSKWDNQTEYYSGTCIIQGVIFSVVANTMPAPKNDLRTREKIR